MNERIENFIEQCDGFITTDDGSRADTPVLIGKDIEKFAELIIRECVKVMYDNAIERKVPPDINQTPTHYAIAVLDHFGVEE